MASPDHRKLLPPLGFLAVLLVTAWAYLPGLGGQLVFDDLPNLQPWQDLGDLNTREHVLSFVFSGAGIPGRPLSLLSFLVDDQSWQPDIFSLKRTNLALHLLNFCLVFWLCLKLLPRLLPASTAARQGALSLLVAAVWSLHPLQVSNVSYIIQRMNLLSTLLELAGLLLFVQGRVLLAQRPRTALALCSLGIGLLMPLAILAKENGLLLCAFALLVEGFCFRGHPRPGYWRLWKLAFLWLPLLAFVAYSLLTTRYFTLEYPNRNFNSWERLLTQGHVVTDYLRNLLLPRLQGSGLYFDNYPVARTLADPATLACWTAIALLIAGAIRLRHSFPLAAFGILFYFSGHLMESTLLPLELYFEHRNYLPQLGLWLALAALPAAARSTSMRIAAGVGALLLLLLLTFLTRHNAGLWSDPDRQTAVWYHDNPGSLRTTLAYSQSLLEQGRLEETREVLARGVRQHPGSLSLVLSQRLVQCFWLKQPVTFSDLPQLARTAAHENGSIPLLERLRKLGASPDYQASRCTALDSALIADIYRGLLENPRYQIKNNTYRYLNEYLAEIALTQGDLNQALYHYDAAFEAGQSPIYPYRQALLLANAGHPAQALVCARAALLALTPKTRVFYPDLEPRIRTLIDTLQATPATPRPQ